MTAEIVNLRRVRKAKARAEKEAAAAANRARFGRTTAEKHHQAKQTDLAERRLDGHKLNEAPKDGDA